MTLDRFLAPVIGLTILLAALAITAWPESPVETETAHSRSPVVQVAEVRVGAANDTVRFAGVTRAATRAELAFSLPARLAGRPVEIGDQVATGEVLATLDDREFRLAATAAEAAVAELDVRLAQAQRDLDRVQRLVDARAATTEELERTAATTAALEAAWRAAQARLDDARRLCEESTLRAPFAGTVTRVSVEPGEWVSPGRAVVELAGDGEVEVLIEVPETVHSRIEGGLEVRVELPFSATTVNGRIVTVAAAASGPGRLFPVEVAIDPRAGVVAGLTADVTIPLLSETELTVPLRAVVNPGSSNPTVFRIVRGLAEQIPVELGRIRGDRIAVGSRLAAKDLVAVTGHTGLRDGDAVEVRR
jgi:RND family efflux transporter MFP subunit